MPSRRSAAGPAAVYPARGYHQEGCPIRWRSTQPHASSGSVKRTNPAKSINAAPAGGGEG